MHCVDSSIGCDIENFYDKLLDVLSEGIYISDNTGKTLKVNRMYEQLTGLVKEELIGQFVMDLKSQGKFDVIVNPEVVRTGQPKTSVQLTMVGKQVVLNGYPVFDQSGKVSHVVTFVRDITLLSELKEQIYYQQMIIDTCQRVRLTKNLVFGSQKMIDLLELINRVAKTDATVLLLGETGVGKDLLARKIHENSFRNDKPYFKVDCASLPENLIESELFGYEQGAFSGANVKGKPGFFEIADKGTLFLDEIGELSLSAQTRLLRVLQDKEILRIGSTKIKKIDVRLIAATNRNLSEEVDKGNFRKDLFYRIRVAEINIPPLRERKEDISILINHFLNQFNMKYKKNISFSKIVEKIFQEYTWPGNVRELENLIQSLIVTNSKEIIEQSDLPINMQSIQQENNVSFTLSNLKTENKSLNEIMCDFEKAILQKFLTLTNGSISEVAKILQVDRVTIFRKIKRYSLSHNDFSPNTGGNPNRSCYSKSKF